MNLQFTTTADGKIHTNTSNEFQDLSEDKVDEFFDWCGSEDADEEVFLSANVFQDDDTIVVDFLPKDPQRVVDLMANKLGVSIEPFANWYKAVDNE